MAAHAPIALFVHDNAERAGAALEALARCDQAAESALTVFSDGPSDPEDGEGVRRVRETVGKTAAFGSIEIVAHDHHHGRSRLLIDSVTRILAEHDRVIVVEDDLHVAPPFLRFLNDGLERYATDTRLASVCGFSYRLRNAAPEIYFLPGAHCWGWATWRRAWSQFVPDPASLVCELVRGDLIFEFDGGGAEPLTQALEECTMEDRTSWSLCWMATALVNRMLTLYPGRSMVDHLDYSHHRARVATVFESSLTDDPVELPDVPVEVSDAIVAEIRGSLVRWRNRLNWKFRLYSLVAAMLPQRIERSFYTALIRGKLSNRPDAPASAGQARSGTRLQ